MVAWPCDFFCTALGGDPPRVARDALPSQSAPKLLKSERELGLGTLVLTSPPPQNEPRAPDLASGPGKTVPDDQTEAQGGDIQALAKGGRTNFFGFLLRLAARLPFLFKKEFELCNVRPDETVVLVSDLKVRPEFIGAAFAAAQEIGCSIYEMKLNMPYSTTHIGGEHVFSVKGGIEAIEAADLCICFHIPLGSEWMARGRAAGTRFLMIYDHPDDLERLLARRGLGRRRSMP